MIEIEIDGVYNIHYAIRGMRNPLNSWSRSDSGAPDEAGNCTIGKNDVDLAERLIDAGPEHAKFLRFIPVCMEITAPLYWWKEFDTYKFAEKNSTSTMHKITSRKLDISDFAYDAITGYRIIVLDHLNDLIEKYKATELVSEQKKIFRAIVQDLPSAYLQKRTVITNYAELRNIYFQRRSHKLNEWKEFCAKLAILPYAAEFIFQEFR